MSFKTNEELESDLIIRSLQAERDRLRDALVGLMPWEVDGVLEHCDGNKCREPWCAGCFGEDVAEANVERLHAAFRIARKVLEGSES